MKEYRGTINCLQALRNLLEKEDDTSFTAFDVTLRGHVHRLWASRTGHFDDLSERLKVFEHLVTVRLGEDDPETE